MNGPGPLTLRWLSILIILLTGGCQEAYQTGPDYGARPEAVLSSPGFALETVQEGLSIVESRAKAANKGDEQDKSIRRNNLAPEQAGGDVSGHADARLSITKAEAVEMTLAASLVLREMEVGSTAALERTKARDRLRNPEMRLNRRINVSGDPEAGWEAGLRWRPPKAGELTAASDQNLADYGLIRADEKEFRRELISMVFDCFSRAGGPGPADRLPGAKKGSGVQASGLTGKSTQA